MVVDELPRCEAVYDVPPLLEEVADALDGEHGLVRAGLFDSGSDYQIAKETVLRRIAARPVDAPPIEPLDDPDGKQMPLVHLVSLKARKFAHARLRCCCAAHQCIPMRPMLAWLVAMSRFNSAITSSAAPRPVASTAMQACAPQKNAARIAPSWFSVAPPRARCA